MTRKKSKKPASSTVTIPTENSQETPESTDRIPAEYSEETRASTVIWRIENIIYSEYDQYSSEIASPEFVLRSICENALSLYITPSLEEDDLCIFVVHLRTSRFAERVAIDAEWSFLSHDGYIGVAINESTADSTHPMHLSTCRVYINDFNHNIVRNDVLTIRLRVWKSGETSTEEEERVQLATRYLKEPMVREKFFWHIRNFSALRLNSGVTMTIYMRGDAFTISFFLRGAQLDEASVGISITTKSPRDKGMQVAINLVSENNETPVKIVETKIRFTPAARSQTWDLPDLMPRKKILESLTEYLVDDCFILSCGFLFDIGSYKHSYIEECYSGPEEVKTLDNRADDEARQTHSPGTILLVTSDQEADTKIMPYRCRVDPPAALELSSSQKILLCDIKNLFTKKTLSDLELRSENRSFAVHKNILCARSAVFEEMFCGDMKAASSMDVPDLDCETLGHFLFFLYTGTVEHLQWKEAIKLYDAALQYRVRSLEDECRGILMSGINLWNAADIFEMADRVQDQELRSYTFDFIQYNFEAVVLSDEWGKFLERSILAGKAMTEIYMNRKYARTV